MSNRYTLLQGDCNILIQCLATNSVDLILVDEPYGSTKNRWDAQIDHTIWNQKARILKKHGAIVHFGTGLYYSSLVLGNKNRFKHEYCWLKKQSGNFAVAKYMPLSVYENIAVFTSTGERVNYYPIMRTGKMRKKGGVNPKTNGQGFGNLPPVYYENDQYYPTNVLEFPAVPRKHSLHPSQKPVELLEYLIKTYSKEGDTVLDYCMGVGSTIIAALNTNRMSIGIEKDKNYFSIAKERVETHNQNLSSLSS